MRTFRCRLRSCAGALLSRKEPYQWSGSSGGGADDLRAFLARKEIENASPQGTLADTQSPVERDSGRRPATRVSDPLYSPSLVSRPGEYARYQYGNYATSVLRHGPNP